MRSRRQPGWPPSGVEGQGPSPPPPQSGPPPDYHRLQLLRAGCSPVCGSIDKTDAGSVKGGGDDRAPAFGHPYALALLPSPRSP
eukprot:7531041-Alexandrium_andersonii.AAC.1